MALRRPEAGMGADGKPAPISGDDFLPYWPDLFAWLTDAMWDDGKPRKLPTMLVCVDDGCWKACLNDRALERSTWVTGRSWAVLLDALDEGIREGTLQWRRNAWGKKGR